MCHPNSTSSRIHHRGVSRLWKTPRFRFAELLLAELRNIPKKPIIDAALVVLPILNACIITSPQSKLMMRVLHL